MTRQPDQGGPPPRCPQPPSHAPDSPRRAKAKKDVTKPVDPPDSTPPPPGAAYTTDGQNDY